MSAQIDALAAGPASAPKADPGVVSVHDLRRAGMTRKDIESALRQGELKRIRRGWYSRRICNEDAVEAVFLGGALTSVSAAPFHRLWAMPDGLVHVAVPHNASRLRLTRDEAGALVDRRRRPICLHWVPTAGAFAGAVLDADRVLMDACACQPRENVIAMADSALNRGVLRQIEVEACVPLLAPRCDGASQAGTESLVRERLRCRGIRARSQVWIGDVGAVDLLVGDRLVIECDSAEYHDDYHSARDYDRDLALAALGYVVLRLRYDHVMHRWDRAERAILAIVRERRHLRRGRDAGAHVVFV
jgi:very-short-patch-repair endonuclease